MQKKLRRSECEAINYDENSLGNGIVNMDLLTSFIQEFKCSQLLDKNICGGALATSVTNLGGLAQQLTAVCTRCSHQVSQDLSKRTLGKLVAFIIYIYIIILLF